MTQDREIKIETVAEVHHVERREVGIAYFQDSDTVVLSTMKWGGDYKDVDIPREKLCEVIDAMLTVAGQPTMTQMAARLLEAKLVCGEGAQLLRGYEKHHRDRGDAVMRGHEAESMKKAGAQVSYVKADRNARMAERFETFVAGGDA